MAASAILLDVPATLFNKYAATVTPAARVAKPVPATTLVVRGNLYANAATAPPATPHH